MNSDIEEEKISLIGTLILFPLIIFIILIILFFYDWSSGIINGSIYKVKYIVEMGYIIAFGLAILFGFYMKILIIPFGDEYLEVINRMSNINMSVRRKNKKIIIFLLAMYFLVVFLIVKKYFPSVPSLEREEEISFLTPLVFIFAGGTFFFHLLFRYYEFIRWIREAINISMGKVGGENIEKYFLFNDILPEILFLFVILGLTFIVKFGVSFYYIYIIVIILILVVLFSKLVEEIKKFNKILKNRDVYLNLIEKMEGIIEELK